MCQGPEVGAELSLCVRSIAGEEIRLERWAGVRSCRAPGVAQRRLPYSECDKELLEAFDSDVSVFLPHRFPH